MKKNGNMNENYEDKGMTMNTKKKNGNNNEDNEEKREYQSKL